MILIVSNSEDVHAKHIAGKLRQRGRDVVCLSKRDFGARASVAFSPDGEIGTIATESGRKIVSHEVSAVWYRRPGRIHIDADITDPLDRTFAENEWAQTLDGFFTAAFRRVVSPPLQQRAATKPLQLSAARRAGLRVPQTLITSDAREALAFVARHSGQVIHKAITAPPHCFIATRAWDREAAERVSDLAACPTIVQERIPGPADVRVTVVGRRVLAACIQTARGRAGVDSRLDADAPCSAYDLPGCVESAILRLMEALGLVFGTIDLKLTESGEHVFLEVNPQGQFLYIEILTGLPISDALADFLSGE
jgi:hypothetical protein